MTVALLISTYNWPEALQLVLKSSNNQTTRPDEILIADDGSTEETKKVIDRLRLETTIPIKHIWQEDKGFRKTSILNKTIAQTDADYIIQIDGDCIIHKRFIEDHVKSVETDTYLYGRRAFILQDYVNSVLNDQQIEFSLLTNRLQSKSRNIRIPILDRRGVRKEILPRKIQGCNLSYWKKDILAINGYNEDFEGWGLEDLEVVMRLSNIGIFGKKLRYSAIQYHIYHNEESRDHVIENQRLYKTIIDSKTKYCEKGISQYMK